MNLIKKLANKASRYFHTLKYWNALSHSYSQSAEDIIIRRTLSKIGIKNVGYIDIGCNHPIDLNNTYLLYKTGGAGILADANPDLLKIISRTRRRDRFVNVGIDGASNNELVFYTLSNSALSTFDKEMVEKIISDGKVKILKKQKVPVIGINDFLEKYYQNETHFVSIDVEGFDTKILTAWDFKKYRPTIFCVETISHLAAGKKQTKVSEIFEIFDRENYIAFADTYINTIFVDKEKWFRR